MGKARGKVYTITDVRGCLDHMIEMEMYPDSTIIIEGASGNSTGSKTYSIGGSHDRVLFPHRISGPWIGAREACISMQGMIYAWKQSRIDTCGKDRPEQQEMFEGYYTIDNVYDSVTQQFKIQGWDENCISVKKDESTGKITVGARKYDGMDYPFGSIPMSADQWVLGLTAAARMISMIHPGSRRQGLDSSKVPPL